MLSGEEDTSMKKHISRERDMVCLCLDGFRRAARLCCGLGKSIFFSEVATRGVL